VCTILYLAVLLALDACALTLLYGLCLLTVLDCAHIICPVYT